MPCRQGRRAVRARQRVALGSGRIHVVSRAAAHTRTDTGRTHPDSGRITVPRRMRSRPNKVLAHEQGAVARVCAHVVGQRPRLRVCAARIAAARACARVCVCRQEGGHSKSITSSVVTASRARCLTFVGFHKVVRFVRQRVVAPKMRSWTFAMYTIVRSRAFASILAPSARRHDWCGRARHLRVAVGTVQNTLHQFHLERCTRTGGNPANSAGFTNGADAPSLLA